MPTKRQKTNGKHDAGPSDSMRGASGMPAESAGMRAQPSGMPGSGSRGMRGSAMDASAGTGGMGGMAGMAGSRGGRANGGNRSGGNAMGRSPTRAGGGGRGTTPEGTGASPPPTQRTCGVMDVHRRLLSENADYRRRRAAIETRTRELLARTEARFAGVVHIPVVVHVVWNTAEQNISDAQVVSQIDVLNRDFRATNPDVSTVPSAFSGLVADSRMEFFLATTDPAGNPTGGVTRDSTSVASFSTDDAVKAAATGGADPWPADHYLNIWVAPLGGGLLGYAQFPGGPAETDGVVITYTAFGTTGTATPPFHLGRTATHEIGHYFNLFHIWGDDGSGCGGSDEVDDTPNQAGPNVGVPTFPHVTCGNGPNGDLFMDYMDYVDDPVMVMFTQGQAARMEACVDTVRSSLPYVESRPTPAGPVLAWGSDRLDAFVLGTDRALYHKWWDGSAWGPSTVDYEYQGGICMSEPEVASWGPNRLDAFVLGTDRAVYHKWWDGSAWGPSIVDYEYLGGVCLSPPRLATWGPDRLDLFVLGSDSALYHKWWDGSAWGPSVTDYEYLGGACTSPPEVVAWGENRLDVFVLGPDNALYHKWWDGSAWGPSVVGYEYLGGVCASPPTAVAWGENRLDLFVLGLDHALYHKWWDGSAWGPSTTDWEYMGGVCTSRPTAVAWGQNRLDVFVTGIDSALYHKWWDGSAWGPSVTDYEYMGGICTGRPRVASWAENRLDVFVTGIDSALYHKWWDGSAWGPSVTDYEYLGGVISAFRIEPFEPSVPSVPLPAAAQSPGAVPVGARA
jgi:hypothetical protein